MKKLKHFILTTVITFFVAFSFVFASCSQITSEDEGDTYSESSVQNEANSARFGGDEDGYVIGS
ncbi:hypothetical protein [Treponema sp. UBA3813]|uniref:hypothetical protein n=1 Tax=Treponema sp. UBA3813 TaxID=1947715 RepID=UPI0025F51C14|nr:hypothetical protein [Treponema sp. UBA3813]